MQHLLVGRVLSADLGRLGGLWNMIFNGGQLVLKPFFDALSVEDLITLNLDLIGIRLQLALSDLRQYDGVFIIRGRGGEIFFFYVSF